MLEDNDPFAQYHYLVTVYTGHRRGAATSSKVPVVGGCVCPGAEVAVIVECIWLHGLMLLVPSFRFVFRGKNIPVCECVCVYECVSVYV